MNYLLIQTPYHADAVLDTRGKREEWCVCVWGVMKVKKVKVLVAQSCLTLCDPARPLCPWDSPGKNTGVGCHSLLQGIFPTQGSNLRSPALAGRFFTS